MPSLKYRNHATLTLFLNVHSRHVLLNDTQAPLQRSCPLIDRPDFFSHPAHQILRKARQIANLANETTHCEDGCCFQCILNLCRKGTVARLRRLDLSRHYGHLQSLTQLLTNAITFEAQSRRGNQEHYPVENRPSLPVTSMGVRYTVHSCTARVCGRLPAARRGRIHLYSYSTYF